MRRYSYYYTKPTHSTLERRGDQTHNIWHTVGIVLAIVAIVIILALVYGKIKALLRKRKCKAHGQGSHLRSQSLRKKEQSLPSKEVEQGPYSPFDDDNRTESVYSTYINMPTQPMNTYRSSSPRSMYGEQQYHLQNTRYALEGVDRMNEAHIVNSRNQKNDGFDPAPRDGARLEGGYDGSRF